MIIGCRAYNGRGKRGVVQGWVIRSEAGALERVANAVGGVWGNERQWSALRLGSGVLERGRNKESVGKCGPSSQ